MLFTIEKSKFNKELPTRCPQRKKIIVFLYSRALIARATNQMGETSACKKYDKEVENRRLAWHMIQDDVTGQEELLLMARPKGLKLDRELPSYELLHVRTGIGMEGTLGTASLVVNGNAPYAVLSSLGDSPWLQWKQTSRAASQTFCDLMHRTQDQAAVLRALCMARRCPVGGVVTLTVSNTPAFSLEWPYIFIALRTTTSAEILVKACALRKCQRACQLEPRLHTEWWHETEQLMGNSQALPCWYFAANYDSDESDNSEDSTQQIRDPLELLATQRFLAQDLLRRAGME